MFTAEMWHSEIVDFPTNQILKKQKLNPRTNKSCMSMFTVGPTFVLFFIFEKQFANFEILDFGVSDRR